MSTVSVGLSLLLRQSQQSDTVSNHPEDKKEKERDIISVYIQYVI